MSAERWFTEQAPSQRWFGDKGRAIADVSIVWSANPLAMAGAALFVADFHFSDGARSRYFAALGSEIDGDITSGPSFTRWLIGTLLDTDALPSELTWQPLAPLPAGISVEPGRGLGVQQSNTSIRYPGDLLIKVNRRLAEGVSPEVELTTVIQHSQDHSSTTPTFGSLWMELPNTEPMCLAIASQFVPNSGDGWSTMLDLLQNVGSDTDFDRSLVEVEAIANLTASMHRALASDPWRQSIAPELVGDDDITIWSDTTSMALEGLLTDLGELRGRLPVHVSKLVDLIADASSQLRRRIQGFTVLRGTHKIRTHGDYHLGQVLRKPSGNYVAIDFDGEPERPLPERLRKNSALRDVAGMLRSFSYVRGTVEMKRAGAHGGIAILREWESAARERFTSTYAGGISNQLFTFAPSSEEDVRLALRALELEKAIYECRYEMNNRPDWLWLPLTSLVHEV